MVVDREAYPRRESAVGALLGIEAVLGPPEAADKRWTIFSLRRLRVELSEKRFFPPFQPLLGMDNGGQGPPQADRGPGEPMGIHSGREAARCPL